MGTGSWLIDGGEMGARIRAHDWSRTLGPLECWPQSLRTAVQLMLASAVPATIIWGPDHIQLYNDAYARMIGARHPDGLGQPILTTFPGIRSHLEAVLACIARGESGTLNDVAVPDRRDGSPEGVWFHVAYSPLRDEAGAIAGAFALGLETTARRAEWALAASEERLHLATEAAGMFSWDADLVRHTLTLSANAERILGRRLPPLSPDNLDLIHPDDRQRLLESVGRAVRTSGTFTCEIRVCLAGDRVDWVRLSGGVVREHAERPARIVGVAQDVTLRKRQDLDEAFLAELGSELGCLAVPDEIMRTAAALTMRHFDVARARFIETEAATDEVTSVYDSSEAGGGTRLKSRPLDSVIPAAWSGELRRGRPVVISDAKADGAGEASDVPDDVAARARLVVPHLTNGALDLVVVLEQPAPRTWRDDEIALLTAVTDWIASALEGARVFEAREQFAALVEESNDFIGMATLAGEAFYVNPAGRRMVGLADEDAVRRTRVGDYLPPRLQKWFTGTVIPTVLAGGFWEGEVEFRNFQTGAPIDVHQKMFLIRQPASGELVCLATTAVDVSGRKRAERERQALLTSLAHDLLNPLTVLRGQFQLQARHLARHGLPDAGSFAEWVEEGGVLVTRVIDLVEELRDQVRLASGEGLSLHLAATDLAALVQDAVDEIRRTGTPHTLHMEVEAPDLTGMWDAARLRRVVMNLLGNAVKYSPEGGEITVQLTRDGDEAVLRVRDHGIGIPREDLSRIFDLHSRASNVGTIKGSGVGLAGARQIVAQHGGIIAVESAAGEGSTFTVRLPLEFSPAARSDPERGR